MSNTFVHSVFFWLKEDLTTAERQLFEKSATTLLSTPGMKLAHLGTVATTDRPVIDRSYSYNLVLVFNSQADHDAYQETDATHQAFISACKSLWTKVLIYDSIAL